MDWSYSDTVKQGNQENKIRATANTTASGPQSGKFAFAAISFETDEQVAEVNFDNLTINEP